MTGDNKIPSDDLGDWAEHQFASLCAAAGMVANKATRDKMGWDYLVELPPISKGASLPLDRRPNGLRCRVQIKAHWSREAARIPITLSAAERLAKDPGPAFVFVMTAEPGVGDDDPKLVGCYLLQMIGETLARVLERLRKAQVDPLERALSDQTITFDPTASGQPVATNGKSLREALQRESGSDFEAYVAKKS